MIRWLYRACNRNWWQIPTILLVIAAILAAILVLQGCGGARPLPVTPAPKPGVGDQLRSLGASFITWGGLSLGLALCLRIALGFGGLGLLGAIGGFLGRIPLLGAIASLGTSGGASAVVIGAAFTWLAAYLWAVILACLAAGVACVWYHWPDIRRWLDRREKPSETPLA